MFTELSKDKEMGTRVVLLSIEHMGHKRIAKMPVRGNEAVLNITQPETNVLQILCRLDSEIELYFPTENKAFFEKPTVRDGAVKNWQYIPNRITPTTWNSWSI